MTLFSLFELMDEKKALSEGAAWRSSTSAREALSKAWGSRSRRTRYFVGYYGLIDFEFWVRKNIGDGLRRLHEGATSIRSTSCSRLAKRPRHRAAQRRAASTARPGRCACRSRTWTTRPTSDIGRAVGTWRAATGRINGGEQRQVPNHRNAAMSRVSECSHDANLADRLRVMVAAGAHAQTAAGACRASTSSRPAAPSPARGRRPLRLQVGRLQGRGPDRGGAEARQARGR